MYCVSHALLQFARVMHALLKHCVQKALTQEHLIKRCPHPRNGQHPCAAGQRPPPDACTLLVFGFRSCWLIANASRLHNLQHLHLDRPLLQRSDIEGDILRAVGHVCLAVYINGLDICHGAQLLLVQNTTGHFLLSSTCCIALSNICTCKKAFSNA